MSRRANDRSHELAVMSRVIIEAYREWGWKMPEGLDAWPSSDSDNQVWMSQARCVIVVCSWLPPTQSRFLSAALRISVTGNPTPAGGTDYSYPAWFDKEE